MQWTLSRKAAVRAIKLLGGANVLGDCPVGASEPFGNRCVGKTTIDVKLGFQTWPQLYRFNLNIVQYCLTFAPASDRNSRGVASLPGEIDPDRGEGTCRRGSGHY